MKLHFGRKIAITLILLFVFSVVGAGLSDANDDLILLIPILAFLWPFAMVTWYLVLKFKQRKKFLKKMVELGDIVGMNFDEFTKKMDMPNPKGITKAPEGMAYEWYFSGSRNTGIVVIVDNGMIVDYELNDESAFKYM